MNERVSKDYVSTKIIKFHLPVALWNPKQTNRLALIVSFNLLAFCSLIPLTSVSLLNFACAIDSIVWNPALLSLVISGLPIIIK